MKQLAEEFKGQFQGSGENTKKYITFSVPTKEEVVNGKKRRKKEKDSDSKKEEHDHGK